LVKYFKLGEGLPVIVDVLRASSTIITALANGIIEVIPVKSKKEAFKFKKQGYLIAGEQYGRKIEGFDIGNSPVELLRAIKEGSWEKLALKTTNATKLLCSLPEAYIVSTLNLEVASRKLRGKEVSLIAVGSRHGLEEDMAVVLALNKGLNGARIDYQWVKERVVNSRAAKHLRSIGYGSDVDFIVNTSYDVLPKLEKGIIKGYN